MKFMDDEEEEKQTINCTVESCVHHDDENEKCELDAITVEPPADETATGDPEDESMCGDYEEVEEEVGESGDAPIDVPTETPADEEENQE